MAGISFAHTRLAVVVLVVLTLVASSAPSAQVATGSIVARRVGRPDGVHLDDELCLLARGHDHDVVFLPGQADALKRVLQV